MINCLTLGETAKIYNFLKQEMKQKIANDFGLSDAQFNSILKMLTKFRNMCAHNERFLDFRPKDSLSLLPIHRKLNITNKYGRDDLFATFIICKTLLTYDDFNKLFIDFISELKKLKFDCLKFKNNSSAKMLKLMNFPENYLDLLNC